MTCLVEGAGWQQRPSLTREASGFMCIKCIGGEKLLLYTDRNLTEFSWTLAKDNVCSPAEYLLVSFNALKSFQSSRPIGQGSCPGANHSFIALPTNKHLHWLQMSQLVPERSTTIFAGQYSQLLKLMVAPLFFSFLYDSLIDGIYILF